MRSAPDSFYFQPSTFTGNDARTRPAVQDKMSQGTANMDDHETRRKIVSGMDGPSKG
jgi:hypothetical protein